MLALNGEAINGFPTCATCKNWKNLWFTQKIRRNQFWKQFQVWQFQITVLKILLAGNLPLHPAVKMSTMRCKIKISSISPILHKFFDVVVVPTNDSKHRQEMAQEHEQAILD